MHQALFVIDIMVRQTACNSDLGIIFKPEILTPIVGLAVLVLIPVGYKKWKARKAAG